MQIMVIYHAGLLLLASQPRALPFEVACRSALQVSVTMPAQHHLHTSTAQRATLSINSYTASMQHLLLQDVPAASMPAASMPAASMLSLQQVEAQMVQNPVPALLSLQQVEAQQAAQQLLQGPQQQAAAEPAAAFGSVDFIPGLGPAEFSDSAADAGESSQVRVKVKKSLYSRQVCTPPLQSAVGVWLVS